MSEIDFTPEFTPETRLLTCQVSGISFSGEDFTAQYIDEAGELRELEYPLSTICLEDEDIPYLTEGAMFWMTLTPTLPMEADGQVFEREDLQISFWRPETTDRV